MPVKKNAFIIYIIISLISHVVYNTANFKAYDGIVCYHIFLGIGCLWV